MKTPNLIQRGTIERPLGDFRNQRISQAVDMDYMGSSEFEFGALPRSLRAMEAMADEAKLTVVDSIEKDGKKLRVFHFFSEEEFKEYEAHLLNLRNGKIKTKERTQFDLTDHFIPREPADFWWDIENHVMWSFDKNFMNHISEYIAASLNYMNAAKAV